MREPPYLARGDGQTDDTRAIQAALDSGLAVYIPSGSYLTGDLALRSNLVVFGDGQARTVLLHKPGGSALLGATLSSGRSGVPGTNVRNITIRDLQLRESVHVFAEHVHLLSLNGASEVLVQGLTLSAANGDGIYLGGSDGGAVSEWHNEDIRLEHLVFLGSDKQNRNAISIIDCTRCTLDDIEVHDWVRSDMPAAIDIEPNPTPPRPFTVDTRLDTLTLDGHTYADGQRVHVSNDSGELPAPLDPQTLYYVINSTHTTFQLAASPGGPVLDITTPGRGASAIAREFSRVRNIVVHNIRATNLGGGVISLVLPSQGLMETPAQHFTISDVRATRVGAGILAMTPTWHPANETTPHFISIEDVLISSSADRPLALLGVSGATIHRAKFVTSGGPVRIGDRTGRRTTHVASGPDGLSLLDVALKSPSPLVVDDAADVNLNVKLVDTRRPIPDIK